MDAMNFEKNECDLAELFREEDRIINRNSIGEPSQDPSLVVRSNHALLVELQTYLGELSARALNDPDSAESLWAFAGIVCRDLWEICGRKPDVVRACAARKMFFPVNWPLLKQDQKKVSEMTGNLGVGTCAIYRIPKNKKQFNPDAPVNKLVMSCIERISDKQYAVRHEFLLHHLKAELDGKPVPSPEIFIQESINRLKTPWVKKMMSLSRLSLATADDWAETIWENILRTHNGTPEKHPELYKIGKYRARHSEHIGQQEHATQGPIDVNIRDGIKERVFKAVRALAS